MFKLSLPKFHTVNKNVIISLDLLVNFHKSYNISSSLIHNFDRHNLSLCNSLNCLLTWNFYYPSVFYYLIFFSILCYVSAFFQGWVWYQIVTRAGASSISGIWFGGSNMGLVQFPVEE